MKYVFMVWYKNRGAVLAGTVPGYPGPGNRGVRYRLYPGTRAGQPLGDASGTRWNTLVPGYVHMHTTILGRHSERDFRPFPATIPCLLTPRMALAIMTFRICGPRSAGKSTQCLQHSFTGSSSRQSRFNTFPVFVGAAWKFSTCFH